MSVVLFAQNGKSLWKTSTKKDKPKLNSSTNLPQKNLYDLDLITLQEILVTSPKKAAKGKTSKTLISLPNADGVFENFRVYENPVMDAELAARYPQIKSYIAIGIENPNSRAYFSFSPLGFKSMTLYPDKPAEFIEPLSTDLVTYTVYQKSEKEESLNTFECSVIDIASGNVNKTTSNARLGADDGKLRTIRLALSCTAEYTKYFGGTKALALAGMNNTMTRCNGIFEMDFGLKLELIATTDAVIFTDPLTDPYSDASSKSNWNSQLQSTLTSIIGESNYDIGHLFGATGGGGNAGCIGCICVNGYKGSGYTSPSNGIPAGDSFDLDYVAHEMGHQLGASHTFTYVTETSSNTQMEPGSGSTIMSYAGITTKDVQRHSDPYFHSISIQQVTNNIKNKACPIITLTGNAVPVVNAGLDYTIPKGTPFMLTGSATDANADDVMTYNWEEMDLGTATTSTPSGTATSGPIFRSYIPSVSPIRYFPKMATILSGLTTTSGTEIPVETLPSVARTLTFRLTVRDNRAGGSANNTDDTIVTVDGTAGPFSVSSPNTAVTYAAGNSQTITWNVAGTNANGVNCANVDVFLSTDGGQTFSITLLSGTANDGSEDVVIPNIVGNNNRIMIKGSGTIFFDVSDASFTISASVIADTIAPTTSILSASGTSAATTNLSWIAATDNVGVTGYYVYQNGIFITSTTSTTYAISGLLASTSYDFYVVAKDAAGNISLPSNSVNVTPLLVDTISPTTSILSASGTTLSTSILSWSIATDNKGVAGYDVYQNSVFIASTTSTTYTVSGLLASTSYDFYIVAKDAAGNGSLPSNSANVTPLFVDTISPTTPTLSASGTTTTTINLSWIAATDNVGVSDYDVYQNGVFIASTTSTTYAISGLLASTSYDFYVIAKDAAGNISLPSNSVNVTPLLVDTLAPTAPILSASGTSAATTNLSWSAATDNKGIAGYDIYQNGVLMASTTSTNYAVLGLSALTTYDFYIVAKDAAGNASRGSNPVSVSTLAIIVSYCTSYSKSTSREYINRVQLGSINNLSGNNNGYGNFTTLSTNLVLGSSNSISITPAWTSSIYAEAYRVWIDFNQDGDFTDAGEQVFSRSKTKTALIYGSFTIPATALLGSTRMRVSMKYNTLPSSCGIFSYGEVEDYTVTITASTGKINIEKMDTESIAKSSIKLYPNPVKGDVLNISSLESPSEYRIFNRIGQELAKGRIENDSVNVGSLTTGAYFIQVIDNSNSTTKQFIKQ